MMSSFLSYKCNALKNAQLNTKTVPQWTYAISDCIGCHSTKVRGKNSMFRNSFQQLITNYKGIRGRRKKCSLEDFDVSLSNQHLRQRATQTVSQTRTYIRSTELVKRFFRCIRITKKVGQRASVMNKTEKEKTLGSGGKNKITVCLNRY